MPTPKKGESRQEFVNRCIPYVMKEGKAKDNKHAAAMCNGMWEQNARKSLAEFSLEVKSAGVNKNTGERYWKAGTSDIFPDSYQDEMSKALYDSFLDKIERGIKPPLEFRSELWEGGNPYLSIAHYREHSIAGDSDRVYVDGAILKAQGTFRDTSLGKAAFDAVWDDLYVNKEREDKIRISIAFLDFKHQHKSNGVVFERTKITEVCPECIREASTGESAGRIFLDGLLLHFAMTRIPVNTRTFITTEVTRSMTTKKEDAASIVGAEHAEELEEKETALVGKSDAVIIKSDDETEEVVEETAEKTPEEVQEETPAVENTEAPSVLDSILARLEVAEQKIIDALSNQETALAKSEAVEEVNSVSHPLDEAYTQLKSDYDSVSLMESSTRERLIAMQGSFDNFVTMIQQSLSVPETKEEKEVDVMTELLTAIKSLNGKVDLLTSQNQAQPTQRQVPVPRSFNPASVPQEHVKHEAPAPADPNQPTKLRSLIDRSVGVQ